MRTMRNTDWFIQLGALLALLISIPFVTVSFVNAALLLAGAIQLTSAAFNTRAFFYTGLRDIRKYWLFASLNFLLILFCWVLPLKKELAGNFLVFAIPATVLLSIYYMVIYKRLIDNLHLRNELAGFTKSH